MNTTFREIETWQKEWPIDEEDSANAEEEKEGEIVIPKKVVFTFIGAMVLIFLIFTGVLNRGYESRTVSSSGLTRNSGGTTFGSKYVFLRKGQTFVVDYDADIQKGSFYLRLRKRTLNFGRPAVDRHHVKKSGSGQFRVTAPETGLYKLMVSGFPGGNGYAYSYTLSWRSE